MWGDTTVLRANHKVLRILISNERKQKASEHSNKIIA